MPVGPGVFSLGQIAVSAVIGTVAGLLVVWLYGRQTRAATLPLTDSAALALLTGLSILVWRLAGNTQVLNNDPIPLVSPNDVLCPVVTYVVLSVYVALRGTSADARWAPVRAWLTIVSLIVNIVTI